MRLRNIIEGISKTDFFDFYSLLMAYQSGSHDYDPQKKMEIKRRLEFEASIIFDDQMDQLFSIVARRMYEPKLDDFYRKWVAPTDDIKHKQSMLTIPKAKRVAFLKEVDRLRKENGTEQWFTSTDGRWSSILHKYIELAGTRKDLNSIIMGIDRIYGLCHHGGMLADYFDERRWLEDALHIRSIGDQSQIVSKASSDVRELVGKDHSSSPVIDAQKLKLAIDKETKGVANTSISGSSLVADIPITVYLERYIRESNPKPVVIVRACVGECQVRDHESGPDADEPISVRVAVIGQMPVRCVVRPHGLSAEVTVNGDKSTMALNSFIGQYDTIKPSQVASKLIMAAKECAYKDFKHLVPDGATRLL